MAQYTYHNQDGVTRTALFDPEVASLTVKTSIDCTGLVENNHYLREHTSLGHGGKSANRLVARIPMTIYEQSIHENWDEDQWKRWLNDPDNAMFRVWKGKV